MGWIWRKGVSVVKKIIAAIVVLTSAPLVVPSLAVATAIALISSLPYCFLLVSYVCTEKLMRLLLPPPPPPPSATLSGGRQGDKMMLLIPHKIDHGCYTYDDDDYHQGFARVGMSKNEEEEAVLRVTNIEENEDMIRKESRRSLLETIRDEGRTKPSLDRGISEKGFKEENNEAKSEEGMNRHEGELKSTPTKASRGKDMGKSSNEVLLYSEEQIWEKMEALRKVVGYSVARSTTYSEELEALYLFTGVEFPTTIFKEENQDGEIAQVSQRLAFLTSLVGIK